MFRILCTSSPSFAETNVKSHGINRYSNLFQDGCHLQGDKFRLLRFKCSCTRKLSRKWKDTLIKANHSLGEKWPSFSPKMPLRLTRYFVKVLYDVLNGT